MITRLRLWVIVFLLGGVLPSLIAQTFTEQKNTYPLSADGSKYVVNGFIPFRLLKMFALHSVTE